MCQPCWYIVLSTMCGSTTINQTKASAGGTGTGAATTNETSQGASNATQGAGGALNQTGKGISNAGNDIMQGVKNLFGGSGKK